MLKVKTLNIVLNNDFFRNEIDLSNHTGSIITEDTGTIIWLKNGKIHRADGPAIICKDGEKHWLYEGHWLSPNEILERLSDDEFENAIWNLNEWKN